MFLSQFKKLSCYLIALSILTGSFSNITASAATGDIVDVASKAAQFKTLVAAVTAAELVSTLQGTGPFTVLAPTDAAFKKLPAGVLDKLLLPINKAELQKILKYHVVPSKALAADLITLAGSATPSVKSVEGTNLNLTVAGTVLKVNTDTSVTTADIAATNGVVHEIDTVLLPSTFKVADLKSAPAASTPVAPKATPRTGGMNMIFVFINLIAIACVGLIYKIKSYKINN